MTNLNTDIIWLVFIVFILMVTFVGLIFGGILILRSVPNIDYKKCKDNLEHDWGNYDKPRVEQVAPTPGEGSLGDTPGYTRLVQWRECKRCCLLDKQIVERYASER